MGDGEGLVVAGLVAPRLEGVADEHGLLILIHCFTDNGHDQDTEYHHNCQENPGGEKERDNLMCDVNRAHTHTQTFH